MIRSFLWVSFKRSDIFFVCTCTCICICCTCSIDSFVFKVAQQLIADGCELRINERLSQTSHNNYTESVSRSKSHSYQSQANHVPYHRPQDSSVGLTCYYPSGMQLDPRRFANSRQHPSRRDHVLEEESEESIEQLMYYMSLQNRRQ